LFILLVGLYGAPIYAKITILSKKILIPIVASLCVLGAYTFRNLAFDAFLIIFFGLIGYYMIKTDFSMAPFVLAFVLGRQSEINFRRALTLYGGHFSEVILKPVPIILIVLNIILLISPFWEEIIGFFRKEKIKSEV